MKILITENGRRHYYYQKCDKVKQISTGTVFEILDVSIENQTITTTDGQTIPLTKDIRPTDESLKSAKIIDKSKKVAISDDFDTINIKYFDSDMPRLVKIDKGDWIDLRVVKVRINGEDIDWKEEDGKLYVPYKTGDNVQMLLGVAMQLPKDKEAYLAPRSGTFNNYGLILVNSFGVMDESYCGDNDQWIASYYATRYGNVCKYDRVAQFRTDDKMKKTTFNEVKVLSNKDRGGFSSTGVK